ncbi:branched-chain amino acid transport system substrate-binding protein [Rhizomicrobium palustre]|uniref:Branched-chain amino acid transport system substrate-binding protein n=1 Tax=Rhizomicrobium palustre TaxID=189966 RepID=A0A846MVM3_9PROT|nr:ABC transporter substrate-binding protein [Rhizomicrobium palustre]NIK87142.1 branched-chain amino acid transport system substrate-binding protein [Rhizomicrobium palustre]
MKKLLFWAVGLGALLLLLTPQWQSPAKMGEHRFAYLEKHHDVLVVGVSWPIAEEGPGLINGLELARDELNARRLPGHPPIRLIIRDDKNDWKIARKIALEFANTPEMSAVIGYYEDGIGIRASEILEASRLLHFVVNANNRAMTSHGYKYIVRTVQATDQISRFLAISSPMGRKPQKYAMVWEGDAYGQDIAYQYRIAQDALGSEMVYQAPYPAGRPDFRVAVNQLKGIKADVIMFSSGNDANTAAFLRKARAVGITTPILVACDRSSDFSDIPEAALQNTTFIRLYNVAAGTPPNRKFVSTYRARYGYDPDTSAAQGYDALQILAEAVRVSGTLNPLDLAFTVRYKPVWVVANGEYRFDSNGELKEKPLFMERHEGGRVLVDTVK